MTESEQAASPAMPERAWIEQMTGTIALLGGMLSLAVALLVCASVAGRWLFAQPIDGDFEFVKMATAIAVFAFLPYTQARRGNVKVDTFTDWLAPPRRRFLDAFWDIVYAIVMGFIGYCLLHGARETLASGETTMQRQIPIWPSIALSSALCLLLALTAAVTAQRLVVAAKRKEPSS